MRAKSIVHAKSENKTRKDQRCLISALTDYRLRSVKYFNV